MKSLFLSFVILTLGWNIGSGVDLHQEKLEHSTKDDLLQVHTLQKNINTTTISAEKRFENPEVVVEENTGEVETKIVENEPKEEKKTEVKVIKKQEKVKSETKEDKIKNQEVAEPSKEELIHTARTFMDELLQPYDESNNKVKNFNTKQELVSHVSSYATEAVAVPYVNMYFEEKEDGLYIIPMCLNPWITDQQPFTMTKIDDKQYKLSQSNSSDMHGSYTIHLTFKQMNEKWIMVSEDVKY
ncbi:hypothetical protein ACSVDE_14865 [Pseudalkalibacillus sp. Hm43]|uniref:hypothetical protein n=1 Tax=Pseudalkalibacillus sp. Hm43 TaxID=3450742 RepID=UPI003F422D0C